MDVSQPGDFEGSSINFTSGFSHSSAVSFLRKLAGYEDGSDEFRERFRSDPRGVFMEELGIDVSESLIPDGKVLLPPKHQMAELLYYLANEDEFGPVGGDPPLGFTIYIIAWAFKWSGT